MRIILLVEHQAILSSHHFKLQASTCWSSIKWESQQNPPDGAMKYTRVQSKACSIPPQAWVYHGWIFRLLIFMGQFLAESSNKSSKSWNDDVLTQIPQMVHYIVAWKWKWWVFFVSAHRKPSKRPSPTQHVARLQYHRSFLPCLAAQWSMVQPP